MVESILIRNLDSSQELSMDKMTTEDYVLDYVNWNCAETEKQTTRYISQIGATINKSTFQPREIEICGFVIADTEEEMAERKEFLDRFVNPQENFEAVYDRYKIGFQPYRSIQFSNQEEENNNEVICKFKISGLCPNPLFSYVNEVSNKIGLYAGQFHFPLYMTQEEPVIFGERITNQTTMLNNLGDVQTGLKIRIIANDTVQNPTITNVTTGEYFTVNKTLSAGEIIDIDTNIGNKNIKGGTEGALQNYFQYKTIESSWIKLQKGVNVIRYSATSGVNNLSIILQFSPQFLEVQKCY